MNAVTVEMQERQKIQLHGPQMPRNRIAGRGDP
jgi:hypothetical protein